MNGRRLLAVLAMVVLQAEFAMCQNPAPSVLISQAANPPGPAPLPTWLPVPIPLKLYQFWRKYGPWDSKQQGSKYRDFGLYNFGATGAAAGLDQKALLALSQASKPNPADLKDLEEANLQTHFATIEAALDRLRTMAQQDSHLIRIAADFTGLDSNSAWPRENVGFSQTRWNEYRSIFEQLALQEGIVRTEDFPGAIFFVVVARGLCTGGSSAGYAYSSNELSPLSDKPTELLATEAQNNPNRHYAHVFKPLKPNWYAFYEMDW